MSNMEAFNKIMSEIGEKLNEETITAIKSLLEAKDEPIAWRDAAIRLGEELSSVGPDGYYDMDAKEWLDWAMEQNPRGKHSLPQRTWVKLTDEEIDQGLLRSDYALQTAHAWRAGVVFAMTQLKEKNNG